MSNSFSSIDLLAGAGGIIEGFQSVGFTCLFANDFNEQAVETFRLNHPETRSEVGPIESLNAAEIRKSLSLRRGELDTLVGGPPCQGFSINAPKRFVDDPRNSLFATH